LRKKVYGAGTIDLSHTVNSKDNSYTCTIISGQVELFSILLALHGLYSDYYPPYFQDDKFIEVVFEKQPSEMQLFNVINAYVYELSASLNINIKVISRLPKMDFVYISSISDNPRILPNRRRLINIGNGIGEACNLYAKAIAVDEPEAKILYLAKVIEYVSQTVKRKQLVETVSMKLYSNKALNPDAEYIVELEKVFEKLKSQDTDSQVMMATILTCCDAVELAKVAPPFLREFSKISDKSKEETKEQALRKFSSSISATRNQIAHAKANYESSGFECPEDQLDQFAGCVKLAAQQAIRWYSMQPEESRLV
ncbi:MAG TPA: hypothetical protein PKD55_23090, partial [Bellilinea sp.]|nr:hypothetical protein [Bellilinea sp.]